MINIVRTKESVFPLLAKDIRDGHAYESSDGTLYIGNYVYREEAHHVVAFSVDGNSFITAEDTVTYLREVNIEVRITT